MAFWGVEVKPGSPFSLIFDDEVRKRLHISQATLAIGSSQQTSLVQCNVGEKSPVLLCALLPGKSESLQLNLEFDEDEEVVFSVIGPRGVHLTGFYTCVDRGFHADDSESYGEDIANSENEESVLQSDEDEYEDSFIDDDDNLEVLPPSPVSTDAVDDDTDEQRSKTNTNKPRVDGPVKNDDPERTIPKKKIKGASEGRTLEADLADYSNEGDGIKKSEEKTNDIAFGLDPIVTNEIANDPGMNTQLIRTIPKKKGKGVSKEDKILKADAANHNYLDHKAKQTDAKTNDIAIGQNPIVTNEIDVDLGTNKRSNLLSSPELGLESGAKPKKKRKERSKEEKIPEANTDYHLKSFQENLQADTGADDMDQDLHMGKENDRRPSNKIGTGLSAGSLLPIVEEGSEKPKKKRRKREQEQKTPADNDLVPERKADENTPEKAAKKKKEKSIVQKNDEIMDVPVSLNGEKENSINEVQKEKVMSGSSLVRTLSNGLVIKDLESSKSDGKAAALGKKLKVQYTAKLKENGEVIDSNGKAPYRFRLGDEGIMQGWNIGLDGMRAGDKRRLVVPPSLGNGSKGAAKNVPPDSWVIYDVELLSVH
ncbi:peptidyl-prolyl cis-trans isomerase FKBP43-like isoform X2 [Apium graveolens]|uniref:peptidyl-prolyl cis-trans isomerase FKBP43-like isoform X2 n=1 Tax=Apium graveolens TaxID=4045 RepID=UPI003D7954C8